MGNKITAAEYDAAIEGSEAKALAEFIFTTYRPGSFCTSWSSYAITPSTEEELVDALIRKLTTEEYPDWLNELPQALIAMATRHAETDEQVDKLVRFGADAVADLMACNIRENAA